MRHAHSVYGGVREAYDTVQIVRVAIQGFFISDNLTTPLNKQDIFLCVFLRMECLKQTVPDYMDLSYRVRLLTKHLPTLIMAQVNVDVR